MNGLDPLVTSGLQLMLVGMGTVFAFLTSLVVAVRVMSKVLATFVSPQQEVLETKVGGAVLPTHVAAIVGALEQHRRRKSPE